MENFVDVRRIIKERNANLLKWIPGWIIRYLESVLHQEKTNAFMRKTEGYNAFEFSRTLMEDFNVTLELMGKENVPSPPESCIFVSNHPLGGFDAIAIISSLNDVRPDIKFIVNDLLLYVTNLKSRFIGVNKLGKNAKQSLQAVEAQFASPGATFVFPAGLVSRKQKGKIEDLEWKKTFITKAKKYQKPLIPVYIEGRLTNKFYRLANFRKLIGIKLNIEMFYLLDEFFKQSGSTIKITIGKPISPETFDKSKSEKEWAEWMKRKVYQMKTEVKGEEA